MVAAGGVRLRPYGAAVSRSFTAQDPFFPEGARLASERAGIRVRTAAGFEREERALFDAAISRGSSLVTLTYPEFDARGDRNLPSIFLEDLHLAPQESRAVRTAPGDGTDAAAAQRPSRAPALLEYLR